MAGSIRLPAASRCAHTRRSGSPTAWLRPRTPEQYEGLLRLHILPELGDTTLVDVTPPRVRTWYASLLRGPHPGAPTTAKSYRLLRTILGTALEDGLLTRNPCVIKGAGFVFPGTRGQPLRCGTLQAAWNRARRTVGLDGFHFHDLRHTGNTLAAAAGASTKELMARMGHASARAALIYQHAVRDRDIAIAGALSDAIERVVEQPRPEPTQLALPRMGEETPVATRTRRATTASRKRAASK